MIPKLSLLILILTAAGCSILGKTYQEPIGNASAAAVILENPCEQTNLSALAPSDQLIEAKIDSVGDFTYRVSDDRERKKLLLIETSGGCANNKPVWDVRLSPSLPLDIEYTSNLGFLDANLSGLQVRSIKVEFNTGLGEIRLPAAERQTLVQIDLNTGRVDVRMDEQAQVLFDRIDINTGQLDITTAKDTSVSFGRTEVNTGDIVVHVTDPASLTFDQIKVNTGTFELSSQSALQFSAIVEVNSGDFVLTMPEGNTIQVTAPTRSNLDLHFPEGYTSENQGDDMTVWTSPHFDGTADIILTLKPGSGRVVINR